MRLIYCQNVCFRWFIAETWSTCYKYLNIHLAICFSLVCHTLSLRGFNVRLVAMLVCNIHCYYVSPPTPIPLIYFFITTGPNGDVITSYTQIGPFVWHFIFGCQLTASYSFLTSDLLLPFTGKYVAFLFNTGAINLVNFGENAPLNIPAGKTYGDYYYWIAAPVLDNGWKYTFC